jgi:hypothetical protein
MLILSFGFQVQILGLDLESFMVNVEVQMCKRPHVYIREPHQREQRNQVSAPIRVKKFEARNDQKERGYIVAEAVLTREQVEELPLPYARRGLAPVFAIVPRFPQNLFVGDRPCDGSDGNRQNQEPQQLRGYGIHSGIFRSSIYFAHPAQRNGCLISSSMSSRLQMPSRVS